MIEKLDRFLRFLLEDALGITNNEIDIEFAQPVREWSSRLSGQPTINLFLYDVRENNVLRQHKWQQLPPTNGRQQPLKRTPYRLDCHYILTTWVNHPADEHHLLSVCLLALLRKPLFTEEDLRGTPLAGHPYDISLRVASHDKLTNPAELWSALGNEIRPSVSIVVTLAFDPWQEIDVPLVRLRHLQLYELPQNGRE